MLCANLLVPMNLMRTTLSGALLLVAVGCNDTTRAAMGDEHSIIVVAADTLWDQVEAVVMTTLQPRVFGARDEATFRVSHSSPTDPYWGDLRRFRQILAIGRPDDSWVQPALQRGAAPEAEPAIVEAENVWARNQRVTALVVPETGEAAAVEASVDSLASLLDRRYRAWAQTRMYTSGRDTELTARLRRDAGFSLDMPNVYRWRPVSDSAYLFINDQPDAEQLVRSILVTWNSDTSGEPAPELALDWRETAAARYYDWGQDTQRDRIQTRAVDSPGEGGIEVRGVWHGTIDGFPQAGLFITRIVDCRDQNRRYLLDTWLYAPARAKHQYVIQLETLLDSFHCSE